MEMIPTTHMDEDYLKEHQNSFDESLSLHNETIKHSNEVGNNLYIHNTRYHVITIKPKRSIWIHARFADH